MHVHCTVAVAAVVVVVTVATQLGVCARLQRAQAPERRGQHVYVCCCLLSFVRFFYRYSFELYESYFDVHEMHMVMKLELTKKRRKII